MFMNRRLFVLMVLLLAVSHFSISCRMPIKKDKKAKASISTVNKIVVVGLRSALMPGREPDVIRTPITGTSMLSEPVKQDIADALTDYLFAKLLEYKGYKYISPSQAKGVYSTIINSNKWIEEIDALQEVGKSFKADALLCGYIYRWHERKGTDYAVNSPASVAFDLYLINVQDKRILWKGMFDKTQRSLTENLLDMDLFVKAGAKWMTAEKLAKVGIDYLLKQWLKHSPQK